MKQQMASDTSRSRRFLSVYRNEHNSVIIPVVDSGKAVLKDKSKDSGKASTDEQVDSIDSGVDLSYSAIDTDDPLYSSSGCDTDCDVDSGAITSPPANNIVHILCRYDSPDPSANSFGLTLEGTSTITETPQVPAPGPEQQPESGADESGTEFSSVVEIDGDCVIIHSRQEAPDPDPRGTDSSPPPGSIAELCRSFLRSRSRIASSSAMSSLSSNSLPSSEESCRRRHATADSIDSQRSSAGQDTLSSKMVQLRQEMSSLASQDDELFRQLLQLHSSIQTLRNSSCISPAPADISPTSSVCSLPEAIDSCSPVSTLSSTGSRHSQLSSDSTGHYEVINPLFSSTPVLKPARSVSTQFQPFATLSSGTRFGQSNNATPGRTSSKKNSVSHHPSLDPSSPSIRYQRDGASFSEQDRLSRTLPKHVTSRETPLYYPKQNQQQQKQLPTKTKNQSVFAKQPEFKAAANGLREAPLKINYKRDDGDIDGASCNFFQRSGRAVAMRAHTSTTLPGRRTRSVSTGHKSWRFQQ